MTERRGNIPGGIRQVRVRVLRVQQVMNLTWITLKTSFDESSDYSSSSEPKRKKKKHKTKKKMSKPVEYSSSNDYSETESDKPKHKKPKLKKKFIEPKEKAKKWKSPSPPPPKKPDKTPSPPAKRTPPIMVNPPGTSQLLSSNQMPAPVKVSDIQFIPMVSGGGCVSCPSEQWIMLMDYVQ